MPNLLKKKSFKSLQYPNVSTVHANGISLKPQNLVVLCGAFCGRFGNDADSISSDHTYRFILHDRDEFQ
jgi:hypothetical protein